MNDRAAIALAVAVAAVALAAPPVPPAACLLFVALWVLTRRPVVLAVAGAGLVFCGATVGWIHGVGSTSTGQVDAAVTAPLPSGKPRSSAGGASGEGHFLPAPPSLPGTVPSSGHDPLAPPTTVQALDGARPAPALKNTLRGKRALPSQNTSGPASDATPEAQAEDRHRRELDPSPYGHLALPAGAPERR